MNKSLFRLCLTAAVAFIAGTIFMPMGLVLMSKLERPGRYQQKKEAYSFFYRTMNELFEGTYNPEEGSVSPDALETFKKYGPRLGGKCRLFISDDESGYFDGIAFFPSGDCFSVVVLRINDDRMVLKSFYPLDWEEFWMRVMPRTENDSKRLQ